MALGRLRKVLAMRTNSTKIQPAFALIALVFYVGLQAGESLHSIFVPHFICAQHGELTHTQHHHSDRPHSTDWAVSRVADDDKNRDNDEHCHVLAIRKKEFLLGNFKSSLPLVFEERDITTPFVLEWSITPNQPIYRTAPKTSPPSVPV